MDIQKIIKERHEFKYSVANKKTLSVGYGVDNNYIRCAATSIASICVHNKNIKLCFHIISDGLLHKNIERLLIMAKKFQIDIYIYIIDIDEIFKNLPVKSHFPRAIYFRYLLPLLIQSGKILYIDADIINLKPLTKLADLDLGDNIIAVVRDLEWMEKKRCKALGLTDMYYFNSGVILLDIVKWNEAAVFKHSMELLTSNPAKYRYPDQDVLNLLLNNRAIYLGNEYNCLDSNSIEKESIVLLHFAAHPKPWNIAWPISESCNDFNRNIYAEYEALTPWSGEMLRMPLNDKERKIYAKCLFKEGQYLTGLQWYGRYLVGKLCKNYN